MKINNWLKLASDNLSATSSSPKLDAMLLLSFMLKRNKAWIINNPDYVIDNKSINKLSSCLLRRQNHEPISYIIGMQEFYGRDFAVTADTLQPRPETETIIEQLLKLKLKHNCFIIDVGTGSGCIGITAKLELPTSTVMATEINPNALKIAVRNAKNLNADVSFYKGDLLSCIPNHVNIDVILANLPYVPNGHTINEAAMHEPEVAIFGGEDGLDLYRQLFEQIGSLSSRPRYVITETLPPQHRKLESIAGGFGFKLQTAEDFIQVFA